MSESVRADKWLWAMRFCKTRAIAAKILGDGKVKRNGHVLKRSSSIQVGDRLAIPFHEGPGGRDIEVLDLLEQRASAPEAQACYEDKTPDETYAALKEWQSNRRTAPRGKPTKKDRREIKGFFESEEG